jgi:hypothetical protein
MLGIKESFFGSNKLKKLNKEQQRLEGFKPSKRYTILKINLLVSTPLGRFFHSNYLNDCLIPDSTIQSQKIDYQYLAAFARVTNKCL